MNPLDSIDKNVLKSAKIEELRNELKFRMLPNAGLKEELVDILLNDNERVIADGIQSNLIEAREKRNEDARKIEELQSTIASMKLSYDGSSTNNNVLTLISQLSQSQELIAEKLSSNT